MNNRQVVVVTGASSGIGKAIATYFAEKKFVVYGLSRRTFDGQNIISLSCDVTNKEQSKKTISYIYEKEGRIDLLVNNAGFGISGSVENQQMEDIKKMFDVNFFGVVNMAQQVLPYMRRQGFGKIISTGSVAGNIPIPFQSFYSATKASVDIWAKALRLEVEPFGVQVGTVLVGDTKTGFTSQRHKEPKDFETDYKNIVSRSVAKMEHDEQNGKSPITVAKVVYKMFSRKKTPATKVVGMSYKTLLFLQKILPQKFMLWVVKKLYC